eukprot:4672346-Pyramimonas_sp.AAC.1
MECFEQRGLIPIRLTAVDLPTQVESWTVSHNEELDQGFFGRGSEQSPVFTHGDDPGGPDTHDPRLRWVGLAMTAVGELPGPES